MAKSSDNNIQNLKLIASEQKVEGGTRISDRDRGRDPRDPELPLVSVITVCRNAQATIQQTIRSVLSQTYNNIEYIIIDGASDDSTISIVEYFASSIEYFVSEPDSGFYDGVNKGISLASGEFILLLNADDWYEPQAVEKLVRAARYSGCDISCARARVVDGKGNLVNELRPMPVDYSQLLRMCPRHETLLVPAKVYDEIGPYDTSLKIVSDFDLVSRLFEAGKTFYEIPEALINFRNTGVSSTLIDKVFEELEIVIGRHFPFLTTEECAKLVRCNSEGPDSLIEAARNHAKQNKFIMACRAMLLDRVEHGISIWNDRGAERFFNAIPMPAVSVIIPVYQAEDYIERTIETVRQQTLENIEIICVDDCSPDTSASIIEKLCRLDSRISYIKNEQNIGAAASRNIGARKARGRYLLFLDADDTLPSTALSTLFDASQTTGAPLVRGAYLRQQAHHGLEHSDQVISPLRPGESERVVQPGEIAALFERPEGHCATLIRAELCHAHPYPEDLSIGEDCLFLLRLMAKYPTALVNDIVHEYRPNPSSAMNQFLYSSYKSVLEWRRRAYHVLADHNLFQYADGYLRRFVHLPWHRRFREYLPQSGSTAEVRDFAPRMRAAFLEAGITTLPKDTPKDIRPFLQSIYMEDFDATLRCALDNKDDGLDIGVEEIPKVSVILPFFRSAGTIGSTLECLTSQTLKQIEIICIDDLGGDQSLEIVRAAAAQDRRIKVVQNTQNLGHGASRNHGIRVAKGEYIFHVDPDDLVPAEALERLYSAAKAYGSDMIKGAYQREQIVMGEASSGSVRKGLSAGSAHIVNTTLADTPSLLSTTEGHWSYLYKRKFAAATPYPEDLNMGQDSIFIVNALCRANKISVTDILCYIYRVNPNSAMNTFNTKKFLDSLEWRRRAWLVLDSFGHDKLSDFIIRTYWNPKFFDKLTASLSTNDVELFKARALNALKQCGYISLNRNLSPILAPGFERLLTEQIASEPRLAPESGETSVRVRLRNKLRIATLSLRDYGGAGTGTRRRVAALRDRGVDARIISVFRNQFSPWTHLAPTSGHAPSVSRQFLEAEWNRHTSIGRSAKGKLKADEFFATTRGIADAGKLKGVLNSFDVVHLHWISGMLDIKDFPEVFADKPVAWTLADMNAITGGCHYSEGCENFTAQCEACPLLSGGRLAYQQLLEKKRAYDQIGIFHIVCPSSWLADRVERSGLLGDRPVHVIPNAMPVDRFTPTDKLVARRKLGLPLDRKLVLFGADNLTNQRKGGSALKAAVDSMRRHGSADGVEFVYFGANTLDVGAPAHAVGRIEDEAQLSLVYSACDVFAFPSREDNAPLTVGEAMLSGTPVVAFPVGNVPDLVRHKNTGYLARYDDVDDFAAGLAWALSAPRSEEAIRRSLRCRRVARAYHDPSVCAQRHIALYEQMMEEAARRGINARAG